MNGFNDFQSTRESAESSQFWKCLIALNLASFSVAHFVLIFQHSRPKIYLKICRFVNLLGRKSQITLKYQILYQTRVFCQIRCYGNVFLVIPENLISGIWSVTNDKSDSIFILIPDKLEEHRMVNRKLFWQKYSIFKVLP